MKSRSFGVKGQGQWPRNPAPHQSLTSSIEWTIYHYNFIGKYRNGKRKTILAQKWPYDVIGLSQTPKKSTRQRLFLRSFSWAQKIYRSGFWPQLVIFIHLNLRMFPSIFFWAFFGDFRLFYLIFRIFRAFRTFNLFNPWAYFYPVVLKNGQETWKFDLRARQFSHFLLLFHKVIFEENRSVYIRFNAVSV